MSFQKIKSEFFYLAMQEMHSSNNKGLKWSEKPQFFKTYLKVQRWKLEARFESIRQRVLSYTLSTGWCHLLAASLKEKLR